MTPASAFRWVKPPSAELIPNITDYGGRVQGAVRALAAYIGQKMQDDSRRGAPWQDRTGNARSGLFSAVQEASKDLTIIYLSHGHSVYYGIFLELARGKRYAVVMPTIQANLSVVERMLQDIFRD